MLDIRFDQLVGFDGSAEEVVIPDGVFGIAEHVFQGSGVVSVTIPESVELIDAGAFQGCTKLKAIQLPQGLQFIGAQAFQGCTALEEIILPDGVRYLAKECFQGCTALQRVQLPASLDRIGVRAFAGCAALTVPAFPEGLATVEEAAFAGCTAFTEVHFPDSLRQIGADAFAGCGAICRVRLPEQVQIACRQTNDGREVSPFADCKGLLDIDDPHLEEHKLCFPAYAQQLQAQRIRKGLCPHCGGTYKGIFNMVCTQCGTPKL